MLKYKAEEFVWLNAPISVTTKPILDKILLIFCGLFIEESYIISPYNTDKSKYLNIHALASNQWPPAWQTVGVPIELFLFFASVYHGIYD